MNYISIFSTPIFVGKVGKDLSPLVSECKKQRVMSSGRTISNKGGWQSNDFDGKDLEFYVKNQMQEVAESWGIRGIITPSNYWYNINISQNYNLNHCHPGSILSGVIYLKCPPNSSPIIFQNPISALVASYIQPYVDFDFSPEISFTYSHQPKEGDLLIFPSWLEHRVDSGDFKGERISLSFNSKVEVPSTRKSYTYQQ